MECYTQLAHRDENTSEKDNFWIFSIPDASNIHYLTCNLKRLISDPKCYIRAQFEENKPQFPDGPIIIVFEYGPYNDDWYVLGMDNTNVVSVRCPAIPEEYQFPDNLPDSFLGTTNASVGKLKPAYEVKPSHIEGIYLPDQTLAVAHLEPKAANITLLTLAYMLIFPRTFPTAMNLGTSKLTEPNTTNSTQAKFVLSPRFRFRFEWKPSSEATETPCPEYHKNDPCKDIEEEDKEKDDAIQCIKGTGKYMPYTENPDGEQGPILVAVDEAWTLRWQTDPTE